MPTDKTKIRYPRAAALDVARELCVALKPVTLRLVVAGSLRRMKAEVGDVEVLFVPKCEPRKLDLFHVGPVDLAAEMLEGLLRSGVLTKRVGKHGGTSWGEKNRLAVHVASGIPVDLFAATEANWWNYLVCRTGPAESNKRICMAAIAKGWKWNPYGQGFSNAQSGLTVAMESEEQVFKFVELPFLPPEKRT